MPAGRLIGGFETRGGDLKGPTLGAKAMLGDMGGPRMWRLGSWQSMGGCMSHIAGVGYTGMERDWGQGHGMVDVWTTDGNLG